MINEIKNRQYSGKNCNPVKSVDLLYNKNIFNLFSIQFYNTHLKN